MLPWPELSRPVHLPSLFSPLLPRYTEPSAFLLASHFGANLSGTSHGFIRDGDGHLCAAELLRGVGRTGDRSGPGRAVSMPAGPVCLAVGGQLRAAVLPLLSTLTTVSNWPTGPGTFYLYYSFGCLGCIVRPLNVWGAENSPNHSFLWSPLCSSVERIDNYVSPLFLLFSKQLLR